MGYSIRLNFDSPKAHIRNGATLADLPKGGQYCVYADITAPIGEYDLYLYITFNYSWYFYQTIEGGEGIKSFIGMTTTEALPLLKNALDKIIAMTDEERKTGKVLSQTWGKGLDYDDSNIDYWSVSAKNAANALTDFISLCEIAPEATIEIFC